jgi:rRNA-processing protein FCF1
MERKKRNIKEIESWNPENQKCETDSGIHKIIPEFYYALIVSQCVKKELRRQTKKKRKNMNIERNRNARIQRN